MSDHVHEFRPAVAPDYVCDCGAIGRRKNGVVVAIKSSVDPRSHRRGVLDLTRVSNLGDAAHHMALRWGQRHVSYQRDTEEM
mgnify:CR=1 FL=1